MYIYIYIYIYVYFNLTSIIRNNLCTFTRIYVDTHVRPPTREHRPPSYFFIRFPNSLRPELLYEEYAN